MRGIVVRHGTDLFQNSASAGGYTPARRAERIAGRLKERSATHQIASKRVVLPADTVVKVRLDRTISSDRNKQGDRFTATVEDVALPEGTRVSGVVLGATPADRQNPGKLGMDFRTLEFSDGQQVTITGTATSLDEKSVRIAADGRLVATPSSKRNTGKYMAYGAGAGLLLGSLFGKSGLGGLLGAGAGYVLGQQKDKMRNRDIVLREGLQFGVRLDKEAQIQLELARSDEPDDQGEAATADRGGSSTHPRPPDSASPGPGAPEGESPGAAPGVDRSTSAPPRRPAGHEPDDEARTGRPPSPPPGPAEGDVAGSRVRVSGETRVSLVTDPGRIPIGRLTDIEFRIEDLSAGGEPVRGATVRAWLTKMGERAGRSSPVHFTSETGTYGVQHTFDSAADYRLTVGVLTETEDAFKVEFILPVVASAAEGEGRATGSEPGGRPGGRPIDTGSGSPAPRGRPRGGTPAADRAHVEVTADGFIEVEWRATDPPVSAVTFALLDATGKTLDTRRVTAAPFATRFPRPADAYFADGLTHVQVSAEHAGGLKAEVVVPVRKTLPRQDDPTVKPARLAAISDWNTFYHAFRAAVARRDRAALKSCMVETFLFTLDEYEGDDPRDAAFQYWDRPDVKGWDAINGILREGCRIDPLAPSLVVSPPQWLTNPNYLGYRVGFERWDGYWRWVWAMHGV